MVKTCALFIYPPKYELFVNTQNTFNGSTIVCFRWPLVFLCSSPRIREFGLTLFVPPLQNSKTNKPQKKLTITFDEDTNNGTNSVYWTKTFLCRRDTYNIYCSGVKYSIPHTVDWPMNVNHIA